MLKFSNLSLGLDDDPQEKIPMLLETKFQIPKHQIRSIQIVRKAVDARYPEREISFVYTIHAEINQEERILKRCRNLSVTKVTSTGYQPPKRCSMSKRPVVIGSGPAGLFAAYTLSLAGAKPLLLERGASVQERQHDILTMQKDGILNPDSNVQFGEGGAGTFSDGKLNTGTKDPRNTWILRVFAECGAPSEILYLAKPHIGTDRLPGVIAALREKILSLGGEICFHAKMTDFSVQQGRCTSVTYVQDGKTKSIETDHIILAVGHSARDVFELLHRKEIALEQKPFSVGLRIEHLQEAVNRSLYRKFANHKALGAADYKLAVHLPNGRSVYTFCMCPGGEISTAASELGGIVTNGMSCFARNGINANSALLVGITPSDFGSPHPLAGMQLQRTIEQAAYEISQSYRAPAVLCGDFLAGVPSTGFGTVQPTYRPGVVFASPDSFLPPQVCTALREGIPLLARQKNGGFFKAEDAVLTGPETRSSSPVRILRDETMESVTVRGLYPCGEGAGYAGGIVSAAADGIRCAEALLKSQDS